MISPSRIVLAGSLFSIPLLRNKLIEECSRLDPAYDHKRIVYTTLSEKESYVGPAAVFVRQKLLGI